VDDSSAGDARLVAAALGGDKDAFATLVTRHWNEWQDLPSGTAALAAEAAEWRRRFAPTASQHVGPGGKDQVQQ
jgi:hypothetical protein